MSDRMSRKGSQELDKDRAEDHGVKSYRSGMPASPPSLASEQHAGHQARTLWGDAWYRLKRNKLALVSIAWIMIVVVSTVSADLWVPRYFGSPTEINTQTAFAE
ncbi:MAG: hypothetical protein Q8K89_02210, partial [Actinomycetota bacterium]|nr:hypothetical protein [Actinomycetota bacterium]